MKKRVYFIISAVIQILLSVFLIVNANAIVESQIELMKTVNNSEATISILRDRGTSIVIVESAIIIVLNVITAFSAIHNKILRRKGLLIVCTCISFFCSNHTLINLLCAANLIILICSQRKNPEDFPQAKGSGEIPKIEYKKSTKKEIVGAIILILVYFSQLVLGKVIPNDMQYEQRLAIVIVYYIISLITAIAVFWRKLKNDIKLFKENFGAYMKFVLPKYGLALLTLIIANMICLRITNQSTSVNQASVNSLPLWFSVPLSIIWAPIVEEMVFRGTIRRFIKNDIVFIIVSSILFGLIHVTNEASLFNMAFMMIPYASLGAYLAYMYAKSENIMSNVSAHCIQNTIASIITVIM